MVYTAKTVLFGTAPDAHVCYPADGVVEERHAALAFLEEECAFHLKAIDGLPGTRDDEPPCRGALVEQHCSGHSETAALIKQAIGVRTHDGTVKGERMSEHPVVEASYVYRARQF